MRRLFLLGHLGSHSPVLSRTLGSHRQIDGDREAHIRYRTRLDLLRLHYRVRKQVGKPLEGSYVFDEILHEYPIARSILASDYTRGIVLVRRPAASVRSIIELGLAENTVTWHRDFERVARYYETRLAGLLRLIESLRGRVLFVETEALLSNTRHVLDQVGVFLELQSPLQTDLNEAASLQKDGRTAVSVPRPLLARLQNAYDFWCGAMRRSCPSLIAPEKTVFSNQLPR